MSTSSASYEHLRGPNVRVFFGRALTRYPGAGARPHDPQYVLRAMEVVRDVEEAMRDARSYGGNQTLELKY